VKSGSAVVVVVFKQSSARTAVATENSATSPAKQTRAAKNFAAMFIDRRFIQASYPRTLKIVWRRGIRLRMAAASNPS
jgi:hypothetical protein